MSVSEVSAVLALIGSVAGAAYYLDDRHASKAQVEQIGMEFQVFAVEQRIYNLQRRLWQLEDRNGKNCENRNKECAELKFQLERLKTMRSQFPNPNQFKFGGDK